MSIEVGYHWHLRSLMAQAGMFATTDLVPLLAERGVVLSREQVYRLVARVPERLSDHPVRVVRHPVLHPVGTDRAAPHQTRPGQTQ